MKLKHYSETVPVQYEEGRTSFMGMDVKVDPRVLIPRPETELLVKAVSEICARQGSDAPVGLEIGTGSGIIPMALTREMQGCRVMSADISRDALDVANANIEEYGLSDRIELVGSNMFSFFDEKYYGFFDFIVSNPPYVSAKDYEKVDAWVKAEPKIALYGGHDGMDKLRAIAWEGRKYLKPGGFIAVEIGYDQSEKMKTVFKDAGLRSAESFTDFNGYERVIAGFKRG